MRSIPLAAVVAVMLVALPALGQAPVVEEHRFTTDLEGWSSIGDGTLVREVNDFQGNAFLSAQATHGNRGFEAISPPLPAGLTRLSFHVLIGDTNGWDTTILDLRSTADATILKLVVCSRGLWVGGCGASQGGERLGDIQNVWNRVQIDLDSDEAHIQMNAVRATVPLTTEDTPHEWRIQPRHEVRIDDVRASIGLVGFHEDFSDPALDPATTLVSPSDKPLGQARAEPFVNANGHLSKGYLNVITSPAPGSVAYAAWDSDPLGDHYRLRAHVATPSFLLATQGAALAGLDTEDEVVWAVTLGYLAPLQAFGFYLHRADELPVLVAQVPSFSYRWYEVEAIVEEATGTLGLTIQGSPAGTWNVTGLDTVTRIAAGDVFPDAHPLGTTATILIDGVQGIALS